MRMMTVAPFASCSRWHPRRDRSTAVLAQKAGTILLSGPLLTMASFGTPRGHSLSWGPRRGCGRASQATDTHPRTLLVSRVFASDRTLLGDRRVHTGDESLA